MRRAASRMAHLDRARRSRGRSSITATDLDRRSVRTASAAPRWRCSNSDAAVRHRPARDVANSIAVVTVDRDTHPSAQRLPASRSRSRASASNRRIRGYSDGWHRIARRMRAAGSVRSLTASGRNYATSTVSSRAIIDRRRRDSSSMTFLVPNTSNVLPIALTASRRRRQAHVVASERDDDDRHVARIRAGARAGRRRRRRAADHRWSLMVVPARRSRGSGDPLVGCEPSLVATRRRSSARASLSSNAVPMTEVDRAAWNDPASSLRPRPRIHRALRRRARLHTRQPRRDATLVYGLHSRGASPTASPTRHGVRHSASRSIPTRRDATAADPVAIVRATDRADSALRASSLDHGNVSSQSRDPMRPSRERRASDGGDRRERASRPRRAGAAGAR